MTVTPFIPFIFSLILALFCSINVSKCHFGNATWLGFLALANLGLALALALR